MSYCRVIFAMKNPNSFFVNLPSLMEKRRLSSIGKLKEYFYYINNFFGENLLHTSFHNIYFHRVHKYWKQF